MSNDCDSSKGSDHPIDPRVPEQPDSYPPSDPTRERIERFRKGDSTALSELLEIHRTWIQREVSRKLSGVVRAMDETGDVVNEVMLRILKMKELRFTCAAEFRSLVATVVKSTIYSLASKHGAKKRDRRRNQQWTTEGLGLDRNVIANTGSPLSRAAKKEQSELLQLAIEMLDLVSQRLIHLTVEHDCSWKEIGEELGLSEDAARVRYKRALKRLAKLAVKLRTGRISAALELSKEDEAEETREIEREAGRFDAGDDDEDDPPPRVAARAKPRR